MSTTMKHGSRSPPSRCDGASSARHPPPKWAATFRCRDPWPRRSSADYELHGHPAPQQQDPSAPERDVCTSGHPMLELVQQLLFTLPRRRLPTPRRLIDTLLSAGATSTVIVHNTRQMAGVRVLKRAMNFRPPYCGAGKSLPRRAPELEPVMRATPTRPLPPHVPRCTSR